MGHVVDPEPRARFKGRGTVVLGPGRLSLTVRVLTLAKSLFPGTAIIAYPTSIAPQQKQQHDA